MIALVLRQWRRLVLGSSLMTLFLSVGIAIGAPGTHQIDGAPVIVAVSLFLSSLIVVGGLMTGLAVVRPTALPLVERIGLTLLLSAPATAALHSAGVSPGANPFVYVLVHVLVVWLLSGSWQTGRTMSAGPWTLSFRVARPVEVVHRRLYPDPSRPDAYWWRGAAVAMAADGSEVLQVAHGRGPATGCAARLNITEEVPGRLFLIDRVPQDATRPYIRTRIGLAPTTSGTHVTVTREILKARPGDLLDLLLSADLADEVASMKAQILGRTDLSLHGRRMPRAARTEDVHVDGRALPT